MKLMKPLLLLTLSLFALPSVSNAQTVRFLGSGSSAMFLELGQAAQSEAATATPCVWTAGIAEAVARDTRTTPHTDETGEMWVTWSAGSTGTCAAPSGTGIDVYAYMSLDSVEGNRCFFARCQLIMNIGAGTSGGQLLCNPTGPCVYGFDTDIPQVILKAIDNQFFFAAATDVRPEDAKFAIQRALAPCGAPVWR
jgi:hypothetical protein